MAFNSTLFELAEAEILNSSFCPLCGAIMNPETVVTLIRIGNERQELIESYEFVLTDTIAHRIVEVTEPVLFVVVAKRDRPEKEPLTEP